MDWGAIIGGAGNLLNTFNQTSSRDSMADYMRQQEDAAYQEALDKYNYDQQYQEESSMYNSARRAEAARAAAATEAARQIAMGKASKVQQQGYKKALSMYAPWMEAGNQVLPQMTQSYGAGVNNLNLLGAYLGQPDQQKLMALPALPARGANIKI
jgi:hypothetical protein